MRNRAAIGPEHGPAVPAEAEDQRHERTTAAEAHQPGVSLGELPAAYPGGSGLPQVPEGLCEIPGTNRA